MVAPSPSVLPISALSCNRLAAPRLPDNAERAQNVPNSAVTTVLQEEEVALLRLVYGASASTLHHLCATEVLRGMEARAFVSGDIPDVFGLYQMCLDRSLCKIIPVGGGGGEVMSCAGGPCAWVTGIPTC